MAMVTVERRMYVTADGSRAVPEGHPEAARLLCAAGGQVPRAVAERYGLLAPPPAAEPEPEAEARVEEPEAAPEPKARRAPNKARRAAADKAGG